MAALVERYPRTLVVQAAREALDEARRRIRTAEGNGADNDLYASIVARLDQVKPTLRPVVNASGVVIQTNLGRAPLSRAALAAMAEVGGGYSNLEYDLEAGGRGSRHEHVAELLRRLSGAEAGLVVNNNAAALLLILATFAAGREVVVSRGELVEIGGGFRIPDVLRQSGADLVEVGTTNRTYAADFDAAVGERTAMLLRVHTSNFRVVGFVHAPSLDELAAVARRRDVLFVDDLGSGSFLDTSRYSLAREPLVQESVAAGADLVCFSGDKLLGGPQAGIIVGRGGLVGRLKKHPLTRALRPDKITLAALGATLGHFLSDEAEREVPVWRMIAQNPDEIEDRARAVIATLGPLGADIQIEDGRSAVGGGSLPGETLATRLLATPERPDAGRLAARLRAGDPPVVARVDRDRLLLDLRTVLPEEDELLARALDTVLAPQALESVHHRDRSCRSDLPGSSARPTLDAGRP